MKVAVTGAAGFVGAQIVRALVARGDEVYAAVRPSSDSRRVAAIPGVQSFDADFTTEHGRSAIVSVGAECCIHAAWYAAPGKYLSALANVDLIGATLGLATALASGGCRRFVGIGTCFEYDTDAGYLSERTRLEPAHLYSAAKASTYLALKQIGALTGMETVWARLFYLYGPDESPNRLVAATALALLRGETANATAGAQVRDFLHVEDAAKAVVAVAHSQLDDAVNIGSGQPVTVASIVNQLATHAGRPDLVRLGALAYKKGDPMFVCADVRRLAEGTRWTPRWTLSDGLADTLAWWDRAVGRAASR